VIARTNGYDERVGWAGEPMLRRSQRPMGRTSCSVGLVRLDQSQRAHWANATARGARWLPSRRSQGARIPRRRGARRAASLCVGRAPARARVGVGGAMRSSANRLRHPHSQPQRGGLKERRFPKRSSRRGASRRWRVQRAPMGALRGLMRNDPAPRAGAAGSPGSWQKRRARAHGFDQLAREEMSL